MANYEYSVSHTHTPTTYYAILVGVANGDDAWRGLVTIVESIDPRPYIFNRPSPIHFQPVDKVIYTVMYMSDRLLTQAYPNFHLPPPPELRSTPNHNT